MPCFIIISALLLSGCLAIDTTARATSGLVLDAASGKPLPGVSVFREISEKSKLAATTDAGGRFAIPAAHTAYITIPLGDAFYSCSLIFKAPGYGEQRVNRDTGIRAARTLSLSTLIVKLHTKA